MDKHDFFKFLDKSVVIGVPHLKDPNALFYYYGRLIEITDDSLILETRNGLLMLTFNRIRQIQEEQ